MPNLIMLDTNYHVPKEGEVVTGWMYDANVHLYYPVSMVRNPVYHTPDAEAQWQWYIYKTGVASLPPLFWCYRE